MTLPAPDVLNSGPLGPQPFLLHRHLTRRPIPGLQRFTISGVIVNAAGLTRCCHHHSNTIYYGRLVRDKAEISYGRRFWQMGFAGAP